MMKARIHFVLALLSTICFGAVIGAVITQERVEAVQQPVRAPLVQGSLDQQPGQFQLHEPQPPKPELEVKPGDSEEIKLLKTEIKELRERVFKLEEKTSWRIRPAAGR